jgi:hypothetical protein
MRWLHKGTFSLPEVCMRTTIAHVTQDERKRFSCNAPIPLEWHERKGEEVRIYLPPVTEAPPEVIPCQSKYYWQVVTDKEGCWWLCEHAIDVAD